METVTVTVRPTSESFEKTEMKRQITITGGSSYSSSSSKTSTIVTTVFHIILRLIALFIVGVVCYAAFSGRTTLFSWHPSLAAIGLLLMMNEAIFTFSGNSYLTRNLKHGERMAVHGALQLAAGTFFLIGFISIYNTKLNANGTHFDTWHGISGLIALILMIIVCFGGILARYSFIISRIIRPVYTKIIHSGAGIVTYLLAVFSLCFGLDSNWFRRQFDESLVTVCIVFAAISAVLIVIQPIMKIVNRVRNRM